MALTAMPLPIGNDAMLVSLYWLSGRRMPDASPGKPVPVGAPNPKACSAALKRAAPSWRAISIVPTFDDSRRMSATVMVLGCESTSAYWTPSTVSAIGTVRVVDGFTRPASIAAPIVTTLAVEPGSNTVVSGPFGSVALAGWAGLVGVAAVDAGHGEHVAGLHVGDDRHAALGVLAGHLGGEGLLGLVLDRLVEGEHHVGALPGGAVLVGAVGERLPAWVLLDLFVSGLAGEDGLLRRFDAGQAGVVGADEPEDRRRERAGRVEALGFGLEADSGQVQRPDP